ncbi:MAG: DinB family protein [Flavobacteriaceae bacterium]|nr:DinB family protein [Flavobacteriaceae bacterium]
MKNHRRILLSLIDNLSDEQLYKIPTGFSNNIIWNLGHILVTQQLLSYGLSNIPFTVDALLIERYRKSSTAPQNVSSVEIQTIQKLFMETIVDFEKDYQLQKFNNFNHYKTSMGLELNSIEESIPFIAYHEGIHFGIILSMMKKIQ